MKYMLRDQIKAGYKIRYFFLLTTYLPENDEYLRQVKMEAFIDAEKVTIR